MTILKEKPTVLQKLNIIIKAITVEPVALLFLTGNLMAGTATQTLSLDKTCRVNLELNEAICDAVRNQDTDDNADNERIVQEYVANLLGFKSIITSILPCLILIFAGGWMDTTGRRKIMMILPVVGELLAQISNILNVIFFFQLKVEYLIFFEATLGSMFGAWSMVFLALFSYIADITTENNRTFRLGLVSCCVYIGMPIGTALSGYLLNSFGYLTLYTIALSIAFINLCYLVFVLSDPVRKPEHKVHDNRGFTYFLKTFFSPNHLLNSLRVVFKKTSDNRAFLLCIMLLATWFLFGPLHGEAAILYMNTRFRFGWDEVQYSFFQSYNMVLNIIGAMISILVIINKLGWHDSVLGILSTSSKIAASFVYCFAVNGLMFYLGPVVDIFNGTSSIALRSLFSKSVEPHEIGKLNSLVGIVEVLMPLGYVSLYTQVYTASMDFMPGLVFLVGGAITVPALLVFIWLLYRHRKYTKLDEKKPHNDVHDVTRC